ncbi:MAG TPA: hypothetical protein PLE99_09530 [Candidatus Thiothrix moscowensis]|uniref:hypothetical protein n=1 Tax=unclassified Thiothrix TaxID=2636184 RepID=UPI0025DEB602|nr:MULTISPECIES: hypothetical protein [unclassified Thiothrix]HRJ52999.1 hypothetical protein [Candidatus Thiothrix moscowensis]HRJ92957.1 hypothetical protein [Candidatus Thiothrix moscowensis]
MTNNEYQTLGMSQYMLREFRDRCNLREQAAADAHLKTDYPVLPDQVWSYPIFNNHACGHQAARELLEAESPEECCRWRFFFAPEPGTLPHVNLRATMQGQLATLKSRYRSATSPVNFFLFTGGLLSALLLLEHPALAVIPLGAGFWYWLQSHQNIAKAKTQLLAHIHKTVEIAEHQTTLEAQLSEIPEPASQADMQECYQLATGRLLRNTLLHLLRPHEIGELDQTLAKYNWSGFITESWGHLQVPLAANDGSEIQQMLLNPENIPLSALQTDLAGRKGNNIYRLQYLHLWVMTKQGLLMGRALYDRVMDHFLYEEHEFYPYAQLKHIRMTEQALPEQPTLKERLPEHLYRRYFRQSLGILSVGTTEGKTYECALLPANERPLRPATWLDLYGLDTDMTRFARQLHEHLLA